MATVSDLLQELAVRGARPAAELRSSLGVSGATLSRLVAAAGDAVCRIGSARATAYARRRSIEGIGGRVPAFRVDASGSVAPDGTLHLLWSGQTWWERPGEDRLFEGQPPELEDMAPQGYLGHAFSARFPELGLPLRLAEWSIDNQLIALARRGEDCVGDLIVGDESLQRFLARPEAESLPQDLPDLAQNAFTVPAGSSAGGEQPKLGAYSGGRHVLVKFAPPGETASARRRRDLLWCEWKALEIVAAAGVGAARGQARDIAGWRFLETERFDRVGRRGRLAVLTLLALNNEHLGGSNGWTAAAPALRKAPFRLSESDARNLRWLDTFGQLIANTDRHLGNVAVFVERDGRLRLAPAYDMLPMALAPPPASETVATREFVATPPSSSNLDVWPNAAEWAVRFWREVQEQPALDETVREFAAQAERAIGAMAERVGPPSSHSHGSPTRTTGGSR
jgi:hypothetical protein